jgi:hypothetical protein
MTVAFELLEEADAVRATAELDGGCYERPSWVRAVAAARRRSHRFVSIRAVRSRGADAWLTGAVHRRGGVRVFEAMPMGGYGGWLCDAPLAADEECELTRAWLGRARWPVVVLTCRPHRSEALPSPSPVRWLPASWRALLASRTFTTHVLDLSGDDAALVQRARPRMRSYLRGGSAGFRFERRGGRAAMSRLHAWYVRGSEIWRSSPAALLPETFFTALGDDSRADAWTILHGEREVGGALFLVGRGQAQYQASGTDRIDAPLTAMEAMLWHAARHYRDRGFTTLNLGASDGLDSVARFKEKFGAVSRVYLRCTYLLPALRRAA